MAQNTITVTATSVTPKGFQIMNGMSGGMSLVDLGKRLLEAAKRGETDTVRALMANGAPFTTDWLGTSPLHFAAQYGHQQTAEVLLRSGISRDARTKVDKTPLHVAAQEGHHDIVELLLQNSADIDAKDMLKMTPLHWATEKGHVGIIDLLVRHGADLNCEDKFDRLPLDIAIGNGRTDIAQMLQLAQHTDIGAVHESDTITIETTEPIIHETVSTSGGRFDPGRWKMKTEVSSDSEQSSTSVLATLAALAEATAPNAKTAEAVNWLESQGITMISTADGGLITSAVESGQTITLTEAGKIALNYIRHDGLAEVHEGAGLEAVVGDEEQKVITIVSNQHGEEDGQVLMTVTEDGTEIPVEAHLVDHEGEVIAEMAGEMQHHRDGAGTLVIEEADGSTITITQSNDEEDDEKDLRRKLEAVQREAEVYKQQLRAKEKVEEKLRQQLSRRMGSSAVAVSDGGDEGEDQLEEVKEEELAAESGEAIPEEGEGVMAEEGGEIIAESGEVMEVQDIQEELVQFEADDDDDDNNGGDGEDDNSAQDS